MNSEDKCSSRINVPYVCHKLGRHAARKHEELKKISDGQFRAVFDAVRLLIEVEEKPKRKIGYIGESRAGYRTAAKRSYKH